MATTPTSAVPVTEAAPNIAQTMRETVEQLALPVKLDSGPKRAFADPVLVSQRASRRIEDLTRQHREAAEFLKPARRKGTASLTTLASLIDWANRFKGENSALFADRDPGKPSLTCIADYHLAGAATIDAETGDPTARHLGHRGVYRFPLSPEWTAWTGIADKALEKDQFGQFLEDNLKDILDPTPFLLSGRGEAAEWERKLHQIALKMEGRFGQVLQLVQLSKSLQINETSNLAVTTNRDTGEAAIQFQNEHRDAEGRPLAVPNLFLIAIPVFKGGAAYRLPVRLKYRKHGPSVKFFLSIYDAQNAFDDAIGEAITKAQTDTALPLFEGTPEA